MIKNEVEQPIFSLLAQEDDFAELVEMFVSELPSRIDNVVAAFENGDRETLRRLAHQLKGAVGSYGFQEVTPFAAALETESTTGEISTLRKCVEDLALVCRRVRAGVPR